MLLLWGLYPYLQIKIISSFVCSLTLLDLREEFNRLARILKQLRQSCQTEEGEDDLKKGTQLLEVIEILSSEDFLI